jgi:hypothetical protein
MSARSKSFSSQSLVADPASVRSRGISSQVVVQDPAHVRARSFSVQVPVQDPGTVRSAGFSIQVLQQVPSPHTIVQRVFNGTYKRLEPGYQMTTIVFPTLKGLMYDIVKRPRFSTKKDESVGGQETRTPFYAFPKWEYELAFDYLPDNATQTSDLKTLMNFFLARHGSYDTFLFHDPDDYQVVDGAIGTGDGTTNEFTLTRLAGLQEPVGQVAFTDHTTMTSAMVSGDHFLVPAPQNTFTTGDGPFYLRADVNTVLPAPLRQDIPYWVYAPVAANPQNVKLCISHADALAGTYVHLISAGSGTFYLYQSNITVKDNGVTVAATDYYITQPNQLVFNAPPTAGHLITATFDFYFLVRFMEDSSDFNKFMDKLWELKKCSLISVPSFQ